MGPLSFLSFRQLTTKLPAATFAAAALLGGCGQGLFIRNSNLRLLLDVPRMSVICPVWSPDGERIYYLEGDAGTDVSHFVGSLMVIDTLGLGRRLLLDGMFGSLAVSPDGRKLVLTVGSVVEGGRLILVDSSGSRVDTLTPPTDTIPAVEFGARGDRVYYYARNRGIFRLNLNTLALDTVVQVDLKFHVGFAVRDDSLLLWRERLYNIAEHDTQTVLETEYPRFHPSGVPEFVGAVSTGPTGLNELVVVDWFTGATEYLRAKPYYNCNIHHPYWSPSGDKVVFSAADIPNIYYPPMFYQLWVCRR